MGLSFGNSFIRGLAAGMFGFNPFWGGCCTPFPMFRNPFCCGSNMLFYTPSMMMGPFTQLMPNFYPPSFNLSMPSFNTFTPVFNIPKPDFSTIWENKDIWKTDSNESSWGDVFKRSETANSEDKEKTNNNGTLKNNPNAKLSAKDTTQYDSLITKYAKQSGVDPNLVKAVIWQESKFDKNAKSGAGAKGLMQLMPDTAKEMGVTNPNDPEQSIQGGTKYLKKMLDRSGGNIERALACYNAGAGHVDDFLNGTNNHGKNPSYKKTANGIPNFSETKKYVSEVMKKYRQYSA